MPENTSILEQLDAQEVKDNNIDTHELEEALRSWFFDNKENIIKLKDELESDNAGLKKLWDSLKASFQKMLQDGRSNDKVLDITKILYGEKFLSAWSKENIKKNEKNNEKNNEGEENNKIVEMNEKIFENEGNDYIKNLEELWIDWNTKLNWRNVVQDIKTVADIQKVTSETLQKYLPNTEKMEESDQEYIVNNIQVFLTYYLGCFPKYQSPLIEKWLMTGLSLQGMNNEMHYYINVVKLAKQLWWKTNILAWNINVAEQGNKDALKFYIKQSAYWKSDKDINKFLWTLLGSASEKNKQSIIQWAKKDSFFKPLAEHIENSKKIDALYAEAEKFGFDRSISVEEIIWFYTAIQENNQKVQQIDHEVKAKIEKNKKDYQEAWIFQKLLLNWADARALDRWGMTRDELERNEGKIKKQECMQAMDRKYVEIMLKKDPKPTWTIPSPFTGVVLDFSKQGVDAIIRDGFWEQFGDQRELFKKNIKDDKQAAFWQAVWMIGGIAGATLVWLASKNLLITSAWFTTGLRLGNGIGQEARNAGERVFNIEEKGNNKIDTFWDSFMRGAGLEEYTYDNEGKVTGQEFVGWGKLATDVWFDYVSTAATFGIGNKFAPFLNKLWWARLKGINIWHGLKFGFEELFMESFLVDIPMNIVHSGVNAFVFGEGEIVKGQTALWNKMNTTKQNVAQYNLEDALTIMVDASKENLSFENLSQVFFNTITYWGLLEWGGAAIRKIKAKTSKYTTFQTDLVSGVDALHIAEQWLQKFLSENKIAHDKAKNTFTKDGVILTGDLQKQLTEHMGKVVQAQSEQAGKMKAFMTEYRQKLSDKNSLVGMLAKFWLMKGYRNPASIVAKRIQILDKKISKEQNINEKQKLEKLRDEYHKIQEKLGENNNKNELKIQDQQSSIPENIQTENSLNSDRLVDADGNINMQAKKYIEKYLQDQGVLWKWETLTEAQARKIYEVHNMERKVWETDDMALNTRKWLALRGLFSQEQIVVLLRGKVCGRIFDKLAYYWKNRLYKRELAQNKELTFKQKKLLYRLIDYGFARKDIQDLLKQPAHIKNPVLNYHGNIQRLASIKKKLENIWVNIYAHSVPILEKCTDTQISLLEHLIRKYPIVKDKIDIQVQYIKEIPVDSNKVELFWELVENWLWNSGNLISFTWWNNLTNNLNEGKECIKLLKEKKLEDISKTLVQNYWFNIKNVKYIAEIYSKLDILPWVYRRFFLDKIKSPNYDLERTNNKYIIYGRSLRDDIVVWNDLLKVSLESNNQESISFLNKIYDIQKKVQKKRHLTVEEISLIGLMKYIIDGNFSEYSNIMEGNSEIIQSKLQEAFVVIEKHMFHRKKVKSIIEETWRNIEQKTNSHEKLVVNWKIKLPQWQYRVKGIKSVDFSEFWKNWFLAPEFIPWANSDQTPYDTDGIVMEKNIQKMSDWSNEYGNWIVIISRLTTEQYDVMQKSNYKRTITKKSVLLQWSKYEGKRFFGVRSGLSSSQVDCILIADYLLNKQQNILKKMKRNIIEQGFYTPIVDSKGTVLFTPEEFHTTLKDIRNPYFWKESKFWFNEIQTKANSQFMDSQLEGLNEGNKAEKIQNIREKVQELYKQKTWNELELTDEQVLSLMDAHEKDGKLGELTSTELRIKVKTLAETIKDPEVRRFLLEAGFSGKMGAFNEWFNQELYEQNKKILADLSIDIDMNIVKWLSELGIDLNSITDPHALIDFCEKYSVKELKYLYDLWCNINDIVIPFDSPSLKGIENVLSLKPQIESLGIDFGSVGIYDMVSSIADLVQITEHDIVHINSIKSEIEDMGVSLSLDNLKFWSKIWLWADMAKLRANLWALKKAKIDIKTDNESLNNLLNSPDYWTKELPAIVYTLWWVFRHLDGNILSKLNLKQAKKTKYLHTLGVKIYEWQTEKCDNISIESIKKYKTLKHWIDKLGINMDINDFSDIEKIDVDDFYANIERNIEKKSFLDQLGINLYIWRIENIQKLNINTLKKVVAIKPKLEQLGIEDIEIWDINRLWELNDVQIQNVTNIKEVLREAGIRISAWNIKELSKLNEDDIKKIAKIKKELSQIVEDVEYMRVDELLNINEEVLKKLTIQKVEWLNRENIVIASELVMQTDMKTMRDFIERKKSYLEKNRTLSEEHFNELFRKEKVISKGRYFYQKFVDFLNTLLGRYSSIPSKYEKVFVQGKYGKAEIKQNNLGLCYAYTGFEILKKSNYFDTMVQTSMREIPWWWEIKVPFGNKDGKTIKVYENELDKKYTFVDNKSGHEKTVNINSNSAKWFKILEIAFIKEYILHYSGWREDIYDSNIHIQNARRQFEQNGIFEMTWELLNTVEWWWTMEFLHHMLWKDIINSVRIRDSVQKEMAFEQIKTWLVKIELSSYMNKNDASNTVKIVDADEDWKVKSFKVQWTKKVLYTGHAYSIEKGYVDSKTGEKMVVVINPRNTSNKIHMTLDQCMEWFTTWEINQINIDKMFR